MDTKEYLKTAVTLVRARWGTEPDILHGFLGIASESGELLGLAKKMYVKGNEPDRADVADELGDLLWYVAILMACYGLTFEEVFDKNILKLESRDRIGKNKDVERKLQESWQPIRATVVNG